MMKAFVFDFDGLGLMVDIDLSLDALLAQLDLRR
jgi:hypothetical protein